MPKPTNNLLAPPISYEKLLEDRLHISYLCYEGKRLDVNQPFRVNFFQEREDLSLGTTIINHSLGESHPHTGKMLQLVVVSDLPRCSLHANHASEEEGHHSDQLVCTLPLLDSFLAFLQRSFCKLDRLAYGQENHPAL